MHLITVCHWWTDVILGLAHSGWLQMRSKDSYAVPQVRKHGHAKLCDCNAEQCYKPTNWIITLKGWRINRLNQYHWVCIWYSKKYIILMFGLIEKKITVTLHKTSLFNFKPDFRRLLPKPNHARDNSLSVHKCNTSLLKKICMRK